MAVVKIFDYKDMITLRANCSCMYVGHAVDVSVDKELPDQRFFVSVNTIDPTSLYDRIKTVFKVLLGRTVCVGEAILTNEDARTLANFIIENIPDSRPPLP
jgi:hypothetical protein